MGCTASVLKKVRHPKHGFDFRGSSDNPDFVLSCDDDTSLAASLPFVLAHMLVIERCTPEAPRDCGIGGAGEQAVAADGSVEETSSLRKDELIQALKRQVVGPWAYAVGYRPENYKPGGPGDDAVFGWDGAAAHASGENRDKDRVGGAGSSETLATPRPDVCRWLSLLRAHLHVLNVMVCFLLLLGRRSRESKRCNSTSYSSPKS